MWKNIGKFFRFSCHTIDENEWLKAEYAAQSLALRYMAEDLDMVYPAVRRVACNPEALAQRYHSYAKSGRRPPWADRRA
jgi:hypothetical protein